jgi:hypothetical protein
MEQKTPKRRGRKPINIDYEQVEHLASLNLGIMDICRSIGVGWDTFDKHRKKKGSELTEALERGKAKGLKRATTALAAKIEDGEFQAIQFYLKSADREKWAERQIEVNHTLNLAHILEEAKDRTRIIDLPRAEVPTARAVERLEKIKGKG